MMVPTSFNNAPSGSTRSWRAFYLVFLVIAILIADTFSDMFQMPEKDPYKILGLSRRATIDAIKKSYRKKAKESHPDKNPGVDPEISAAKFREVVEAFEILSNPSFKQQYDARTKNGHYKQPKNDAKPTYSYSHTTYQSNRQQQREREKEQERRRTILKAKQSQFYVLRVSTLEQLKTVILDRRGRYERHLLMVFTADKNVEKVIDDEMLFPYPFAGSGAHGIWWEDVVQTAKVRYNSKTELTVMFDVPSHSRAKKSGKPYVIFARKGDTLGQFEVYKPGRTWTSSQKDLESWVMQRLQEEVEFVNHHHSGVNLYKQNEVGVRTVLAGVKAGKTIKLPLHPSEKVLVVDERVESYMGGTWNKHVLQSLQENNLIGSYLIKSDSTINIPYKRCYDLSVSCPSWTTRFPKECSKNHEFMHSICPASCGVCIEHPTSSIYYILMHYPLSKIPAKLHGIVQFVRFYIEDLAAVVTFRKNAAFVFFAFGSLLGATLVFLKSCLTASRSSETRQGGSTLSTGDKFFVVWLVFTTVYVYWALTASDVPVWLRMLRNDLAHISSAQRDVLGLIGCGFYVAFMAHKLVQRTFLPPPNANGGSFKKRAISSIVLFILSVSLCVTFVAQHLNNDRVAKLRAEKIWKYRKNAAFALALAGALLVSIIKRVKTVVFHLPKFMFQLAINFLVLGVACSVLAGDKHFMKDFRHVIQLRKNIAVTFMVFGVVFGGMGWDWLRNFAFRANLGFNQATNSKADTTPAAGKTSTMAHKEKVL